MWLCRWCFGVVLRGWGFRMKWGCLERLTSIRFEEMRGRMRIEKNVS